MQPDSELVSLHLSGDRDAFAAIYDRYADGIYGFAAGMLRDSHEAADVSHDTFVLAAMRMGQLRDPAKLRPWLFAIARNEVTRRGRHRSRLQPSEDVERGGYELDPSAGVQQEQVRRLVWDAAAGLDDRDQEILNLQLVQGLDGQDLADAIGVSVSHVYVLTNRMRERLERSLGALLIARMGREECDQLATVLADWDGRFSVLVRKRVARHVEKCEVCDARRRVLVSPASLLAGAMPLLPIPSLGGGATISADVLRDRVLFTIAHGMAPDGAAVTSFNRRGGFPRMINKGRQRKVMALMGGAAAAVVLVVVLAAALGGNGGDDVAAVAASNTTGSASTTTEAETEVLGEVIEPTTASTTTTPTTSTTVAPFVLPPLPPAPPPTTAAPATTTPPPPTAPPATEPPTTEPPTTEPPTTEPPTTSSTTTTSTTTTSTTTTSTTTTSTTTTVPDRTPPVIGAFRVSPSSVAVKVTSPGVNCPGGIAGLLAVATDNIAVTRVTVTWKWNGENRSVELTNGGQAWTGSLTAFEGPIRSKTTVTLTATARDAAGNTRTAPTSLTVNPCP